MKKTLGVNADWKEMVFDICAMLKDKPRETQLTYTYVYALTNGSKSDVCDFTITENQIRMSATVLKNITDEELFQLHSICRAIREREVENKQGGEIHGIQSTFN